MRNTRFHTLIRQKYGPKDTDREACRFVLGVNRLLMKRWLSGRQPTPPHVFSFLNSLPDTASFTKTSLAKAKRKATFEADVDPLS